MLITGKKNIYVTSDGPVLAKSRKYFDFLMIFYQQNTDHGDIYLVLDFRLCSQ